MPVSRRNFIKQSAWLAGATSAAVAIPGRLYSQGFGATSSYVNLTGAEHAGQLVQQDRINQLVLRAVEAGKAAGASFVDARVTRLVTQGQIDETWLDQERVSMGVRAFVNGVWGFAASPYCDLDEAAILARSAVAQAKVNSDTFPRDIDLGSYPSVNGHWSTPIEVDPLTIPMEDRVAFIKSFNGLTPRHVSGRNYLAQLSGISISRLEKTVATSEGSLYSQTYHVTGGEFKVAVAAVLPSQPSETTVYGKGVYGQAAGWELFTNARLREQIPSLIEEAEQNLYIPVEPVNVGRYELIASAPVAAGLVSATLGRATQLDRVLGYLANSSGTSYFGPDHMSRLGTSLGSKMLTVTANRSMSRGLCTTKWDDEGVVPSDFTIVDHGEFVDYQTTRETTGFLSDWYTKKNRPVRSNGCCTTSDALTIPHLESPNIIMEPSAGSSSIEEMIKNTDRGIAFLNGDIGTDFQSISGYGNGYMREIRHGKLGPILVGAQLMFSSLEIWKALLEVGNQSSTEQFGSMRAQPIRLKDMAIIDGTKKA